MNYQLIYFTIVSSTSCSAEENNRFDYRPVGKDKKKNQIKTVERRRDMASLAILGFI